MNIIHYIIGLPNLRHGGANYYACALASAQVKMGNKVTLLYPGDTLKIGNNSSIKKRANFCSFECFSIENPVIEPLLYGIKNPSYILNHKKYISEKVLDSFCQNLQPDIIHLHTLMGMPINLLKYFKSKGIKIVLTSHDYYGICPRVKLLNKGNQLCDAHDCRYCRDCNSSAKNYAFLKLVNSDIFIKYKHLFKRQSSSKTSNLFHERITMKKDYGTKYQELQKYYHIFFSLLDSIHFNSTISRATYEKYISLPYNKIINITTDKIQDHRKEKSPIIQTINIGFIGGMNEEKGFVNLYNSLSLLFKQGYINWKLNVYEGNKRNCDYTIPNICYPGRYSQDELEIIYGSMDLLVVPSKWNETFSLVALEALSYGTPVLMSDHVGAQDIVATIDDRMIYHGDNNLTVSLKKIFENPEILIDINKKICCADIDFSIQNHCLKILELYKETL